MNEVIVLVAYRPKKGKDQALRELMKRHLPVLRNQGLVSDRESISMEAADGTIVEVFGWKSKEHMQSAHQNPAVQELWGEYQEVCDYIPISQVAECDQLFSEFTPL